MLLPYLQAAARGGARGAAEGCGAEDDWGVPRPRSRRVAVARSSPVLCGRRAYKSRYERRRGRHRVGNRCGGCPVA